MHLANIRHAAPALLLALGALFSARADSAPQHVVSTSLCTDEYVFRMVPHENIAALSFLAGDTNPVVSTIADKVRGIPLIHPSAEVILSRKADLVVMFQGSDPRLHEQLKAAHVPVLDMPGANSIAEICTITQMMGNALGAPERARAMIAKMDREIAEVHATSTNPPVQALIYEPNGYATTGGVTDEMMTLGGLLNIASKLHQTRMGTVPVESVVAGKPELLILKGEHKRTPTRADLILRHPALRLLREATEVAGADLKPLLCPGPWSVAAAREFQELGFRARKLARNRP